MKLLVNLMLLFFLIILFHISVKAQTTWNWVGTDNNFALKNQVVKHYDNKIYTNGLTIFYGDSILPYVSQEIFKYDLLGDMIADTLIGTVDTTYVTGNYSNKVGNTFCTVGDARYPNQPTKPYDQFANFYHLESNKNFKYFYGHDSIGYSLIKYAIKFIDNNYCMLFHSNDLIDGGTTSSCKLIVIDSLRNIVVQKSYSSRPLEYAIRNSSI